MNADNSGDTIAISHLLLAILMVAIWGTNFVVINFELVHFHALTFATLRFAVASRPFLSLLAWPDARRHLVVICGPLIGIGQRA